VLRARQHLTVLRERYRLDAGRADVEADKRSCHAPRTKSTSPYAATFIREVLPTQTCRVAACVDAEIAQGQALPDPGQIA
jgi:hypothetical protein